MNLRIFFNCVSYSESLKKNFECGRIRKSVPNEHRGFFFSRLTSKNRFLLSFFFKWSYNFEFRLVVLAVAKN